MITVTRSDTDIIRHCRTDSFETAARRVLGAALVTLRRDSTTADGRSAIYEAAIATGRRVGERGIPTRRVWIYCHA